MRITDIEIERFDIWRDLLLSLKTSGLNVVYGPNEAGKTTLMRFIRGVLYGFQPSPQQPYVKQAGLRTGSLAVQHQGRRISLERTAQDAGRGIASTHGLDSRPVNDSMLAELLQGTDETLFENVFAIGLTELQELATLHDQDVAQHIYGLSLGPEGQQLLGVLEQIERDRDRLLSADDEAGELAELFHQHDELTEQIESLRPNLLRHADLSADRVECESTINELNRRQSGLTEQLKGHQFIGRAFPPWNRVRKYETELRGLPNITSFPENGLATIDEIDRGLDTNQKCLEALLTEADQFAKQAERLSLDGEIQRHASTIQGFVDQGQWIRGLEHEIEASTAQTDQLQEQLASQIEELGPQWNVDRIKNANTSADAHLQLVGAARKYQSALGRQARARKRVKKMAQRYQKRAAELTEIQETLGGLTIEQALQSEEIRLRNIENLGRFKLHESELEQRLVGIGEQLQRLRENPALPKWYQTILWIFVVVGALATIGGFVASVTVNWIAGLLFIFIGVTSAGSAWAFKLHYERQVREEIEHLESQAKELESDLVETRVAINQLTSISIQTQVIADAVNNATSTANEPQNEEEGESELPSVASEEVLLLRDTVRRIIALQHLLVKAERNQRLRRRMSDYRTRMQNVQRGVATARQAWCELLTQLGFDETVSVDDAFAKYVQVVKAVEQIRLYESAAEELQEVREEIETFRTRVEELGHRMQRWDTDYSDAIDVVAEWEAELKAFSESRQQRMQLQRDEKARRTEAREYQELIDDLKVQRAALLVQGGAATRQEFEQRALAAERREELELLLEEAREELRIAAETEPNLAIVEEDLVSFDPEENAECIETLQLELQDIERDAQQAFESLGRLKQEIATLESDRRSTQLRFDREQVATQLRRKAEEWFANELASQAVDQIRTQFEKTCQPAILASAGKFLNRLSGGKYDNIWTPLGQRVLCVDDDAGNTFQVEQLSGGTREQLFLAIRLAMVRDFSDRGIELPMVLDDIIVNFDQLRTEAAIDELLQFADEGQQILFFTCHLHLAHLFESKGVAPIWLPGHHAAVEERKAG